ncbi:MAG: prepilin-type N-terminal cleavage/methylation domain-containing protein [Zetaproteobacteria bacterium]|nr:prepilin-type N-terminal cleavage/methylation domain-containing protein [Zetaproteobacteria bacterium]
MNKQQRQWQKSCIQRGFSLVELMVVVAIIGILASMALPRFRIFQAKARQSEAKSNLAQIYTLEQAYYGENDAYVALPAMGFTGAACDAPNALGFLLDGCDKIRYTYEVQVGNNGATFTATATSGDGNDNRVLRGCPAETWTMNEKKQLTPPGANDVTRCNN